MPQQKTRKTTIPHRLAKGDDKVCRLAALHWRTISEDIVLAAHQHEVPLEAALAVWMVEAGQLPFVEGRPILRLECHKLWDHWGRENAVLFDQHFQFGGHAKVPGASWTHHQFRSPSTSHWQSFHGDQATEYQAFELACNLAGMEAACLSSSFGGPQILGSNHAAVGYASATELYRAFGASLTAQVRGFFEFCKSKSIIDTLSELNWLQFAQTYNGPGQASSYADHINDAYLEASSYLKGDPLHPSLHDKQNFDFTAFTTFFDTLGVKHFSAREFLFRGRHHADTRDAAYGLNRLPPQNLWPNIANTARVVDHFRAQIRTPIVLSSVYRTEDYNAAVKGSGTSQHCMFSAVDFEVRSEKPSSFWAEQLRVLRHDGLFKGAVGTHQNAVHIDTRGENVDF